MLLEKQEITEYHPNGTLFYKMVYATIEPMFVDLYHHTQVRRMMDNKEVHPYVILSKEKWYYNGQIAWKLEFDEMGNGINKHPQYRKDGTVITQY